MGTSAGRHRHSRCPSQALSKRIARLEDRLGPLLERRRGGVVPTAAGHRFLPAARHLLEIADHAVADLRLVPAAPLRVDVWSELQSPARAMRVIAAELPDIALQLSMRRDLVHAPRLARKMPLPTGPSRTVTIRTSTRHRAPRAAPVQR